MKRLISKIKKSVTGDCGIAEITVNEELGMYEVSLSVRDFTIDDNSTISDEKVIEVYKEDFYNKDESYQHADQLLDYLSDKLQNSKVEVLDCVKYYC